MLGFIQASEKFLANVRTDKTGLKLAQNVRNFAKWLKSAKNTKKKTSSFRYIRYTTPTHTGGKHWGTYHSSIWQPCHMSSHGPCHSLVLILTQNPLICLLRNPTMARPNFYHLHLSISLAFASTLLSLNIVAAQFCLPMNTTAYPSLSTYLTSHSSSRLPCFWMPIAALC
jgi:hypothetical protein